MNKIDICFISPSLLETNTTRGGGCEVTDFNVGLQLSKNFRICIISTYFTKYKGMNIINTNMMVDEVPIPAPNKYPPSSNFEIYSQLLLTYFYSLIVALKVCKLIRKNLKILVVHNPQTGLIPALIAKVCGVKLIYAEGNTTPWTDPYICPTNRRKSFFDEFLFIYLAKISDAIRAQSKSIKEGMINRGLNSDKIKIIAAGVDTNEFMPISNRDNKSDIIRVGFIGRLTEIKGAHLLLDLVLESANQVPNVRFYIFGEGPYKQRFIGLPNIDHIGSVPRNKLNLWLSSVDILVFFQKELGRAEIESLSAGKAIIACNEGEMPLMIKHLENGYLCNPNVQSYIDAIKFLSNNLLLIDKLGVNARKLAEKTNKWEIIGGQWLALCMELINRT